MTNENYTTKTCPFKKFKPAIFVICAKLNKKGIGHGMWVELNQSIQDIEKQIYSILEWSTEKHSFAELVTYRDFGCVSLFKDIKDLHHGVLNLEDRFYTIIAKKTLKQIKTIANILIEFGETGNKLLFEALENAKWDNHEKHNFRQMILNYCGECADKSYHLRYSIDIDGKCFVFSFGKDLKIQREKYRALAQKKLDEQMEAVESQKISELINAGFYVETQRVEKPE